MAEILNPHDADLESVILGACLAESTAMVLVSGKLCPEMFYEAKYGEIFAALLAMHRAGKAIDIITVRAELAARGKLEFVGGAFELARLLGRVASSAHLEYHALILRGMYIRREMISGLHRLLAVAADESVDLGDALAGLHQLIEHLEGKTDFAGCLRDMDRLMLDTLRQMDSRVANNRNGITGIPTGLRDLDRLTAGWQRGDLHIIAARPSVGKTAFALHLALAAGRARSEERRVGKDRLPRWMPDTSKAGNSAPTSSNRLWKPPGNCRACLCMWTTTRRRAWTISARRRCCKRARGTATC